MTFTLPGFDLAKFIRETLAEDLGEGLPGGGRDVTSESVIPAEARFTGVMDSRDAIVVAGLPLAEAFFRHLDPDCVIEALARDGDANGRPLVPAALPGAAAIGVDPAATSIRLLPQEHGTDGYFAASFRVGG